jgi:hypothetical protein
MGGNVVMHPWLAVIFTFFVAFNLGVLSGYNILGLLAIHFISIYTAGLNASSPEKVHENFLAFMGVIAWGAVISFVPLKPRCPKTKKPPYTRSRAQFSRSVP